jgi:hypothetical protein
MLSQEEWMQVIDPYILKFYDMIEEWFTHFCEETKELDIASPFIEIQCDRLYQSKKLFENAGFEINPIWRYVNQTKFYRCCFTILETFTCALVSYYAVVNMPGFCSKVTKEFMRKIKINDDHAFLDIENEFIEKLTSAYIIQRHWRKAISDPNYLICRKRLENECRNMGIRV